MKGELPDIIGRDKEVSNNCRVLKSSEKLYNNYIHKDKKIDTTTYILSCNPKLQWLLRYTSDVTDFIDNIDRWNKEVYMAVDGLPTELLIINKLTDMISCDKDQFIEEYKQKVIETQLKGCIDLIKLIVRVYNELKDKKYGGLKKNMKEIFNTIKNMILQYQKLK
jgi:hypothetical protein